MKNFLQRNAIGISLILAATLMVVCFLLIIVTKNRIDTAVQMQRIAEKAKFEIRFSYLDVVRDLDVALRGYALVREDRLLYIKPKQLEDKMEKTFARLDSLLQLQNYTDTSGLAAVKDFEDYIRLLVTDYGIMADMLRNHQDSAFFEIFKLDKGSKLGGPLERAQSKIVAFEEEVTQSALASYTISFRVSIVVGFIMVLLGIPSVVLVLLRLKKDTMNRRKLLRDLEENNQTYLFNSGTKIKADDEESVINNSIANFQKISQFVSNISTGNLTLDWEGYNKSLNTNTLVGKLLELRDNLRLIKKEDDKRNWTNEGLAQFSVLVRNMQHKGLTELSEEVVRFLCKYLKAQQASLFIVKGEQKNEYLDLVACFAFDKKKYVEKQIAVGDGMVGQCYLEADTIVLTEIPQRYTLITSGLGDATPTCLSIIPFKYNDKVEGVFEIAGFKKWEKYEIDFLEKAGEFVASSLNSVKISETMQELLEESRQQTEELKAAEEEMRQNMEELSATQEEMDRRNIEMQETIDNLIAENHALKYQLS
jgi:hypothetical protein